MEQSNPTIAVIIATYKRKDGSTPEILKRAIDSLKEQTYKNYKIFLMGDDYEDQKEFNSFKSLFPKGKHHIENLSPSVERTKYKVPSKELWAVGGTTPINTGISRALEQGINYICMLDHDCIYYPNHLELISKAIKITNSPFIITKGVYTDPYERTAVIPQETDYPDLSVNLNSYYKLTSEVHAYPFIPTQCRFMKLAVCMDVSRIKLRFRDVLKETGTLAAGDADLWNRIGTLMLPVQNVTPRRNIEITPPELELGIFIDETTCSNFDEGYAQTNS